jgi:hypothetical protein
MITVGPLTGFEGIVVSTRKGGRVVLRLQMESRSVQIELDKDMVSRPSRVSRKPAARATLPTKSRARK